MIYAGVQNVIDVLSQVNPDNFDMLNADICIAGHCRYKGGGGHFRCDDVFVEISGIEDKEIAGRVVYPYDDRHGGIEEARKASLEQAVKVLEILRDTGEVRWDLALGLV
jgi:hypothetical protein